MGTDRLRHRNQVLFTGHNFDDKKRQFPRPEAISRWLYVGLGFYASWAPVPRRFLASHGPQYLYKIVHAQPLIFTAIMARYANEQPK